VAELERGHAEALERERAQTALLRAELEAAAVESRAGSEARELAEQCERLRFDYDELLDEKNQLYLALRELKGKEETSAGKYQCTQGGGGRRRRKGIEFF